MYRGFSAIATLLLLLPSAAFAQTIPADEAGLNRFVDNLSVAQFEAFQSRASAGDVSAEVVAGVGLEHFADALGEIDFREGVDKSAGQKIQTLRNESRDLLKLAAAKGDAFATLEVVTHLGGGARDCDLLMPTLEELAAKNNSDAMYQLGLVYSDPPCGISKNYELARYWLEKASQAGHIPAMARIGELYQKGEGLKEDHAAAFRWYLKAAEAGYAPAQNDVGIMLSEGGGVPVADQNAAVNWFRKGAEQGEVFAAGNLGLHYARGDGVERDYSKALFWVCVSNIINHRAHYEKELTALVKPETAQESAEKALAWVKDFEERHLGFKLARAWLKEEAKRQKPSPQTTAK